MCLQFFAIAFFAKLSAFELECLRNQSVLLGRMETIESLLLTSLQNKNDADVVSRSWIWPLKTEQEMDKVELWLQQDERHYQHEVSVGHEMKIATVLVFQALVLIYINFSVGVGIVKNRWDIGK